MDSLKESRQVYSPIKRWGIKNFRNLGEVEFPFDTPIVTLVGDNEAGKTSVVKTFAVLGANGYATEQKDYIRDNTKGFLIECELSDGTTVKRVKTASENAFEILSADGEVYAADKIDRGYGTPVELERVMGMMVEPETKELLQIRTYEDSLLFVLTKSSENYKVMYNALKVGNLTRAISIGNQQANGYRNAIDEYSVKAETLESELESIKDIDIASAVRLKGEIERLSRIVAGLTGLIKRLDAADESEARLRVYAGVAGIREESESVGHSFKSLVERLGAQERIGARLSAVSKIDSISMEKDVDGVVKLLSRLRDRERLKSVAEVFMGLATVQEERESVLTGLLSLSKRVLDGERLAGAVSAFTGLPEGEVDISMLSRLRGLVGRIESLKSAETELSRVQEKASESYAALKATGAEVMVCPNCGADIVIAGSRREHLEEI
jgi:predicted ATP-dependent endonuclease of OLD family